MKVWLTWGLLGAVMVGPLLLAWVISKDIAALTILAGLLLVLLVSEFWDELRHRMSRGEDEPS